MNGDNTDIARSASRAPSPRRFACATVRARGVNRLIVAAPRVQGRKANRGTGMNACPPPNLTQICQISLAPDPTMASARLPATTLRRFARPRGTIPALTSEPPMPTRRQFLAQAAAASASLAFLDRLTLVRAADAQLTASDLNPDNGIEPTPRTLQDTPRHQPLVA